MLSDLERNNLKHYIPTEEVSLAQTKLQAMLTRRRVGGSLGMTLEPMSLYSVDTPCTLTWLHCQATLLGVDCEYRKLRLRQRTCNKKRTIVAAC